MQIPCSCTLAAKPKAGHNLERLALWVPFYRFVNRGTQEPLSEEHSTYCRRRPPPSVCFCFPAWVTGFTVGAQPGRPRVRTSSEFRGPRECPLHGRSVRTTHKDVVHSYTITGRDCRLQEATDGDAQGRGGRVPPRSPHPEHHGRVSLLGALPTREAQAGFCWDFITGRLARWTDC